MMQIWILLYKMLGHETCTKMFGIRTLMTADLHLGHQNIREYCPGRSVLGGSVEEMNAELIKRWNATVRPWDVVYVLGDVCMGKIADTLGFVQQLNGHKHLITGNHDRCSELYTRSLEKRLTWTTKYIAAGFESIVDGQMTFRFNYHGVPVEVVMCHFPYEGDSTGEERYEAARPEDHGQILLHGHVHDMWQVKGRMVNVGVDVHNFCPVRVEKLYALAQVADDYFTLM